MDTDSKLLACQVECSQVLRVGQSSTCERFPAGTPLAFSELHKGHCAFLLHAIYPYLLTLERGGHFRWLNPGEDVIAQCCSPGPAVEVGLHLGHHGELHAAVSGTKGTCPRGYAAADVLEFSSLRCCKLVAELLPVALGKSDGALAFHCQGCDAGRLEGILDD